MKSILDPSFRYTNSASTDVGKTFARIRRQIEQQKQREAEPPPAPVNVRTLERKKA